MKGSPRTPLLSPKSIDTKAFPANPAQDGFVFSRDEIDAFAHRQTRIDKSRAPSTIRVPTRLENSSEPCSPGNNPRA